MNGFQAPGRGISSHDSAKTGAKNAANATVGNSKLVAPPVSTHAARRPLITAWPCPRPLEIPEGFLRVCVLARRRQRPPGHAHTHVRNHYPPAPLVGTPSGPRGRLWSARLVAAGTVLRIILTPAI